ncbi:hypothetical protein D8674_041351 [Pyrus ussuriensis x Pyrus communis]|uniref:Ubiquitin-like domain-containing protein n=1 Tax=Pyrus ussuriensis x Pyrus communis TaxID=2448454 RepID=A0A5N5GUI7_9ROSA|nr:hypothetical protein D8674_041351 [Pyrus ussuriensis x Pyrus communis]
MIENRSNIKVHKHSLWLYDIELENDQLVGHHIEGEHVTLRLIITPLLPEWPKCSILIKFSNQTSGNVRMRDTSFVPNLKSKTGRRWGFLNTYNIALFHGSTKMMNNRPLSAYDITDGSEVTVKIEIDTR